MNGHWLPDLRNACLVLFNWASKCTCLHVKTSLEETDLEVGTRNQRRLHHRVRTFDISTADVTHIVFCFRNVVKHSSLSVMEFV